MGDGETRAGRTVSATGKGARDAAATTQATSSAEFVRWLRNLAVYPGRHIREARLGEAAYRNVYGVVEAVFDATYSVIQSLDAAGQPPEPGGD